MAAVAGMYVIYDKVNQAAMLVDESAYAKVKHLVVGGRPNLEGIDYEANRKKLQFKPLVVPKAVASEEKPEDLIAIYDRVNQAVVAVPRWAYERVKHYYPKEKIVRLVPPKPKDLRPRATAEEIAAHPILGWTPPYVPKPTPNPNIPCELGLVACPVHSPRRNPAARAPLVESERGVEAAKAAAAGTAGAGRPAAVAIKAPPAAATAAAGAAATKAAAPSSTADIFDRVNNGFMTVPRDVYLSVKRFYANDVTFLYDRVNDCPMKVDWSTYMKVKKYYDHDAGKFVPEVAARPGDETLYVNIPDRINGGVMRIDWMTWRKVRRWFLVDVFDKVNASWMTLPRDVYLRVKRLYDDDETYLFDRVNDCPMKVSWHNYCKVRHHYADVPVDAHPGDSDLMMSIPDRINKSVMRIPFHLWRKINYLLRAWEDKEPDTWVWDKVNCCPLKVKWSTYLKVAHLFSSVIAPRPGDEQLYAWIWDRVNSTYLRLPWTAVERAQRFFADDSTFVWDKINKCELKIGWNVFMQVRNHYGFTIAPQPGDTQLHHPIWDFVNNSWMRVPRPVYLNVKKYYANLTTFIYDKVNEVPMKVSWPNYMKVSHHYLDFFPRLACRPGDDTLHVFIVDRVNFCLMRVSWDNYLKVKKIVESRRNA